jgi:hypothetical protein
MTDNQWESREISLWVNNDESLYLLARQSESSYDFFEGLKKIGVFQLGNIKLTLHNVKESWEDAND